MLVLSRKLDSFTHITLTQETMRRLLKEGKDAKMRFRIYTPRRNHRKNTVDVAFEDPQHNFYIERPERSERQEVEQ
jgi:hypothetical protein